MAQKRPANNSLSKVRWSNKIKPLVQWASPGLLKAYFERLSEGLVTIPIDRLAELAAEIKKVRSVGHTVWICGNGGSAGPGVQVNAKGKSLLSQSSRFPEPKGKYPGKIGEMRTSEERAWIQKA